MFLSSVFARDTSSFRSGRDSASALANPTHATPIAFAIFKKLGACLSKRSTRKGLVTLRFPAISLRQWLQPALTVASDEKNLLGFTFPQRDPILYKLRTKEAFTGKS